MDYFFLPNGDLIFIVAPHYVQKYEADLDEMVYFTDLLEATQMLGNGWHDLTDQIGMTSDDIIGMDITIDDEGEYIIHEDSQVWYLSGYRSFNDRLIKDGYCVFTAHEDNDKDVCDYQFCQNAFAFNIVAFLFPKMNPEIKEGKFHLNGETCDSNWLVFPHLVDGSFKPIWKDFEGMVEHLQMVERYDSPWAGINALEYAVYGDFGYTYVFSTILDCYKGGEMRTDALGNRNIQDLIILGTPDK